MSTKDRYSYRSDRNPQQLRIDWDCVLRDLARGWWVIVLTGIMAALMAGAIMQLRYVPKYTAKTTFVICQTGFSYDQISGNLSQASTTTQQYEQVVGSSILRNQVCEELGLSGFPASVDIDTIESSNLMVMEVTSTSPKLAYEISRSVIDNSMELMGYFLDGVTMKELQSTVIPEDPSNPLNLARCREYAGIAGAVIMIIILALISVYKDTVKSVEDVSLKVDTKLLGTIYYEKKRKHGNQKNGKPFSLLLTNPMLSFMYVESYHMLATRVGMAMSARNKKVLMVTSVSENEGKSTVAANIAVALAREGKRTILVDCDFRKPALYKILEYQCPKSFDFCLAVSQREPVKRVRVEQVPGLAAVLGKRSLGSQLDKESFAYLDAVIRRMRKDYEYVILDTSPMAFVADTEEFASLADASLLVIRQDVMETCYINDAIDNLENTGTELLGCVFNGARRSFADRTGIHGTNYSDGAYSKYSHYHKSGSKAGQYNE